MFMEMGVNRMKAIIDRFEGDYAILEMEDGPKKVLKVVLPSQVREGDVLILQGNNWVADWEATRERKEKIEKLARELWED